MTKNKVSLLKAMYEAGGTAELNTNNIIKIDSRFKYIGIIGNIALNKEL
ncbi:unnamed protein product [marine sediment metagenome]|uniref:Uncharacterized protein n=1 Tax=marine sediment metagenome TaxID=412755 RepID=X0V1J0_9ZZZZ